MSLKQMVISAVAVTVPAVFQYLFAVRCEIYDIISQNEIFG